MFQELKEEIKSYITWNKPAFIVYLAMAGIITGLAVSAMMTGHTGHFNIADACKTRCGGH